MGFEKLPDTPWHMGYVKKEEQDPRRHKSRCIYLNAGECGCGKSNAFTLKCPGSSHCRFYAESEVMAEEVYLKTRTIKEEKRDNFQEYLFRGKSKSDKDDLKNVVKKETLKFSGIETVRLGSIKLPISYKEWKPDQKEINALLEYYDKFKKMDKPIILEILDGSYYLKSNFLQYYVSKKLNKTWIRSTLEIKGTRKKKKR